MGKGITGTQRVMDSLEIETDDNGTTIDCPKLVPKYSREFTTSRVEEIHGKIGSGSPTIPTNR